MVNTTGVVSGVPQMCETGQQVGGQENSHFGGRAGRKQDLREQREMGMEKGHQGRPTWRRQFLRGAWKDET